MNDTSLKRYLWLSFIALNVLLVGVVALRPVTATKANGECYTLTLTPPEDGSIIPDPLPNCVGEDNKYTKDTEVTLTAEPNEGFAFKEWDGDLNSNQSPAILTMTGDKTVTATFAACFTLTITQAPGGVISSAPAPNCRGGIKYNPGTVVTLTATHNDGFAFSGWEGVQGDNPSVELTMNGNKAVTATFTKVCSTLTITPSEGGTVNRDKQPDCADVEPALNMYRETTTVELTAVAAEGYEFSGWSGALTGNQSSDTLEMDEDRSVTATFAKACFPLTFSHTGQGVDPVADPPKSEGCDAGKFKVGEVIALTADPADGWRVNGWTGTDDDDSTELTNTLTMPAAAHTAGVTYSVIETYNSYVSVIFYDWPKWQPIGGELTALYTFISCPTDAGKRYAGTRDGLYEWVAGSWEIMAEAPKNVRDFLYFDDGDNDPCDTLYAASFDGGVWLLDEQKWKQVGEEPLITARTLAQRGDELLAGSRDGVFSFDTTSTAADNDWQPILTANNVTKLSLAGDRLYAAVFGLWARYNDTCDDTACDWPEVGDAPFGDAFDVAGAPPGEETETSPAWVVLATARGIYRYRPDDNAWLQPTAPPQPAGNVFALAQVHQSVIAGVQNGGVWTSGDMGATWSPFLMTPGLTLAGATVIDLVYVPGDGLYAVTPSNGVWRLALP